MSRSVNLTDRCKALPEEKWPTCTKCGVSFKPEAGDRTGPTIQRGGHCADTKTCNRRIRKGAK